MTASCGTPLKSILKAPGTKGTKPKRNIVFQDTVLIIGEGSLINLLPPDLKNAELDFDVNPPIPEDPFSSFGGGRAGTMRLKGNALASFAAASSAANVQTAAKSSSDKTSSAPEEKRAPGILEGYLKLLKENGMKSSWMKRYIVLSSNSLDYYRTNANAPPLKSIELNADCYVREISKRSGVTDCLNSLEIFYGRGKSLVLKGSTQRESTEWMTAICAVIDTLRGDEEDDDEFDFIDEEEVASQMEHAPFSLSTSISKNEQLDDEELEWWDEDEEMFDLPPVVESPSKKETKQKPVETPVSVKLPTTVSSSTTQSSEKNSPERVSRFSTTVTSKTTTSSAGSSVKTSSSATTTTKASTTTSYKSTTATTTPPVVSASSAVPSSQNERPARGKVSDLLKMWEGR